MAFQGLSSLVRTARDYGLVNIFTQSDGTYCCSIEFSTAKYITLEAKSGFGHVEPEAAVEAAIRAAEKIVESVDQVKAKRQIAGEPKWLT